ncbi:hypothetical protein [Ekhidna sp.]
MNKRYIIILGALAIMLNSCVYSLFPIYTTDTLVFKEELLGKWDIGEGSYMVFEKMSDDSDYEEEEEEEYQYSIEIQEGFTMSSDEPIFITENGKNVYDEDSIRMIMQERLNKIDTEEDEDESSSDEIEVAEEIEEKVTNKLKSKDLDYSGSISVYEEESYRLTIVEEEGKKEAYIAHLVDIGGDLFMDLYPIKEFDSKNVSDNFFPVHTFYKVAITETDFTMTHFDLDKLNKLFESNLIRLRHENVEGTVLITAQPKELQKFIDTYSDDESVFDTSETYKRVTP